MLKHTKLNLKYKQSKNYHEKGTTVWYIFTSLLLKPLKQHLIDNTSLRCSKLLYFQSSLFKCNSNYGCVFTNCLDHKIYKTKVPTHISPPPTCSFLVSLENFPSLFKVFLLLVTVAMLSFQQYPLNCRSRKYGATLHTE